MAAMATEMKFFKTGTKPSGSVTTFIRKLARGAEKGNVSVPCGSCNACCRSSKVLVNLYPDELKKFPDAVLDKEMSTDPGSTQWRLPKREDGTCVYLIEGKCSIYAGRPRSCRTYDCRFQLFTGVRRGDDPIMDEAISQWQPLAIKTADDRHYFLAARLAMVDGGFPSSLEEAQEKLQNLRNYLEAAKEMYQRFNSLPLEQKEKLEEATRAFAKAYQAKT